MDYFFGITVIRSKRSWGSNGVGVGCFLGQQGLSNAHLGILAVNPGNPLSGLGGTHGRCQGGLEVTLHKSADNSLVLNFENNYLMRFTTQLPYV